MSLTGFEYKISDFSGGAEFQIALNNILARIPDEEDLYVSGLLVLRVDCNLG